jgi:hypothetical protein
MRARVNERPRGRRSAPAGALLAWAVFFLCAGLARPGDDPPRAEADLLIGADSYQRRTVGPSLRFEFPVAGLRAFTAMSYLHSANSRSKGPVDFWLRLGILEDIGRGLVLEASFNHLCRHMTSVFTPEILDANEVLGRVWTEQGPVRLGLGGGFFVGKNDDYRNLLVGNARWERIGGSEFSLAGEAKLVNGRTVYHDLDLSVALAEGTELFVKSLRAYGLETRTYLGFRLSSRRGGSRFVDKLKLRLGWYPGFVNHKLIGDLDLTMRFFVRPESRLLLALRPSVPILRTEEFFGRSRPARIIYALSSEYERKAGRGLLAAGFFRLHVNMPADVALRPTSSLSAGLALRNVRDFEALDRPFRFEAFAGRNFQHGHDVGLSFGVNSMGGPARYGADLSWTSQPAEQRLRLGLFADLDGGFGVRPFLAFEVIDYMDGPPRPPQTRFLIGASLFRWLQDR